MFFGYDLSVKEKMMKTRSMALCLFLVGMMALISWNAAFAAEPVFFGPFPEQGDAVIADCGSFQVLDSYDGYTSLRRWVNEDGSTSMAIFRHWGTDTLMNSVTGKAYSNSYDYNTIVNPPLASYVGSIYQITIPGAGVVLLETGRIVLDREGNLYFEAGPHQLYDGNTAALCAALQ
jgi:hypothetical protein